MIVELKYADWKRELIRFIDEKGWGNDYKTLTKYGNPCRDEVARHMEQFSCKYFDIKNRPQVLRISSNYFNKFVKEIDA